MTESYYYVTVSYPGNWYFEKIGVDSWIQKQFKYFGISESGSGMGWGLRDVGGTTKFENAAQAVKEYFELFPDLKATIDFVNNEEIA